MNAQPLILVVDDEPGIRMMLDTVLRAAGFAIRLAEDVRASDHILADEKPDLILLDWMLPDVSGIEYARRLRNDELTQKIPIVMLTARDDESDMVRGLNTGADDYITKPFSTKELIARIQAVLRRGSMAQNFIPIEIGRLRIMPSEHRVYSADREIVLGPTEFRLLRFFMSNPERVYSRAQILDHVWGTSVYVEERTVDVHIRRLRKALEPYGLESLVQTVRGVGYRFSVRPT